MEAHQTDHFMLHSLAQGIVAAIATDTGAAAGNAGMIDLGGQVVVFDTSMTPQAGGDLRRAVEALFGRAPALVINSHHHNDHIWGNQSFESSTQILSTVRTRELIATDGRVELDRYKANAPQRLATLRAEFFAADAQRQAELSFFIAVYEGLVAALPGLRIVTPTLTFDGRMQLFGDSRKAELIAFENAHSASDAILFLPQEGICFLGDLLFVACNPFLADGDPDSLLHALKTIEKLDATHFVPGHGPVGTRDDLRLMVSYIEDCLHLAQELNRSGETGKMGLPRCLSRRRTGIGGFQNYSRQTCSSC